MNAHDSEKLAGILQAKGYEATDDADTAGLVVFNTCCIRENAENRALGHLGYLKHIKAHRPGLVVAVGGCMPQMEEGHARLKKSGVVDIFFGTHNLHTFGELLDESLTTGKVDKILAEYDNSPETEVPTVREFAWKSGVNIMYGCNNFCSYCVVPYVRGRERSRKPADIIREVQNLAVDGVTEIMLLGQNVNSYLGTDDGCDSVDFPALLSYIARLKPGLERIRFMTSHPKDLSPELIKAIAEHKNICKHIHLPVQSGSDRVLSNMNRSYTRADYLSLIGDLRRSIQDIAITTDIIVGFPGETDEDFAETLNLCKEARFSGAFTFIYSKRSGTKAAEMPGEVPGEVANARFKVLTDLIHPMFLDYAKTFKGKVVGALAEKLENGIYTGRTESNHPIHFPAKQDGGGLLGKIVAVTVTQAKTFYLTGELVEEITDGN